MSGDTTRAGARSVGGGRYILRDLLGQGGMAAVHLAHDSVLDRPVAVKTLHTELGREPSFRERFRREAQAVARLNHPNIVSVYDSGEDTTEDGSVVPFIVMEYVEGRPLRDVLDEDMARAGGGGMPAEKALRIVADVLAALDESHGMGLVHRDIKPGNVMIARRGSVVKVMDFGIARAMQSGVTSMTQTGMVVGTPQYLSPEQALGRGVDERSDLYSVGCMLFELLTGRLPFDGDSPLSIAYQHVQEEPPSPSQFSRGVSPAVDALVARSLRKIASERFPTAEAMREETLRVAAAEHGAGATPAPGPGPHTPPPGPYTPGPNTPPPAPYAQGPGTPPPTPYGQGPGTPPPGPYAQGPSTPPPTPYGQGQNTPPPGPYSTAPGQNTLPPAVQPVAQTPQPSYPSYQQPQATVPPSAYQQQPSQYSSPRTTVSQPARREGKGARRTAVVFVAVGATLFVLLAGLIVYGMMSVTSSEDKPTTLTTPPAAPTTSTDSGSDGSSSVVQGDKTDVIAASQCTDATDSYVHKGSVMMPDFYGKYVDSVEACMTAAGWKYKVKHQNESLFGKGTVVKQSPELYLNPEKQTVTIWVSTGTDG